MDFISFNLTISGFNQNYSVGFIPGEVVACPLDVVLHDVIFADFYRRGTIYLHPSVEVMVQIIAHNHYRSIVSSDLNSDLIVGNVVISDDDFGIPIYPNSSMAEPNPPAITPSSTVIRRE